MQCKDIPDGHVMQLAQRWRDSPRQPGVVAALVAEGVPAKLARTKVMRLCDRGLLDYGVSPNYAWPRSIPPTDRSST